MKSFATALLVAYAAAVAADATMPADGKITLDTAHFIQFAIVANAKVKIATQGPTAASNWFFFAIGDKTGKGDALCQSYEVKANADNVSTAAEGDVADYKCTAQATADKKDIADITDVVCGKTTNVCQKERTLDGAKDTTNVAITAETPIAVSWGANAST